MTANSTKSSSEHYEYPDNFRQDILNMVPADGKIIASVGCGFAPTEAKLVQSGREVWGVDTSQQAIEVAEKRLTRAWVINPGDQNVFPHQSVDGMIFADVLEHIPQAWQVLREYSLAVKPGGWIVISVPNMRSMKVAYELAVRGDWPEHPQGIFDQTHLQVMTKRRLTRWCQNAGLIPERWFDQYLMAGSRQKAIKLIDTVTLKLFHEWFQFRLMVRCRVDPTRKLD